MIDFGFSDFLISVDLLPSVWFRPFKSSRICQIRRRVKNSSSGWRETVSEMSSFRSVLSMVLTNSVLEYSNFRVLCSKGQKSTVCL